MKKLLAKIRKILHDRRTRRFLTRFVSGVAALIVFVTTYALVLPAITMEKEANCGIEAHQHDDFCYTEELICDIPESDGHHHDESCYSTTSALVCETEEHEHSAENGCYDDEGNLICEVMEHRHNEECYEEVRELTCRIPESEGHHHTEDCYEKVLTCGKEVHVHSTACYENDPVSESAIAASTSSAAASTTSVGSVSSAGMTLNFEGDIEKIIDADEPVDGDPVDNLGSDKTNGSSETNDTSEIASSSETNTEAASDTEVTYGRENAGTGRTETSNTALTNADNNATALTSSADTDQYIPQLDAVDFNTVLNNHTGIYYYRAADEDIVEDSSAIPAEDWNRIPNNIDRINDDMDDVELGNKDLLRVYLSYTIPAGSLNATNPVARYRLPFNLHLTDPQVKAINENVNGLAGQYVDMSTLEITDPDKYNAYLGVEAVEGTRRPDEAVEDYLAEQVRKAGKDADDATEYISAVVRVENVYDADGLYGEKDAYLGQDLIFTFAPYSIEKNQHEYDSTGKPTKAGEEIKGWFTFDLNMGQVDFEEPEITTSTVKESDTENAKGDNKDNQIGKDDPEDIKPDAGFGEDDNHQNEHSEDSHSVDNSAADHESVMDAESGKEAENASKSLVTIKRSERSAEIVFIEDGWDEKGNKINQISTTLTAVEKIMVEAQDDDTEENNTETAREDESTAITDNTTEKINNDETEKTASDDKEDTVDVSSGKKTLVDSEESDQIIMPAMSFTDSIKVSTGKPSGIDENAGGILADAAESLPEKAKVLVRVEADEGTFPAGTKMVLKAVTKEDMEALAETVANTVEKDSSDSVENSVPNTNTGDNKKNNVNHQNNNSNSSSNIKAFGFQAVDITFFDKDGNEIEPAKPVRVALTSKTVEQFRKEAENSPIADPVVVHVDNDGNAEQMELVVPEDVEPAKGKTEEELNETIAAEETSTAGDDADTADDSDVDTVKQSEKNENKEPQESSEDSSTETSVGDNISSAEDEMGAVEKGTDTEEQLNPDNDETESKGVTAGTGSTVEFEAESFSVYAIVYTVDFHWEVDGKMYEFSLPGGGFVSFHKLVEVLGISHQDADGENQGGNEGKNTENSPENGENQENADVELPGEVPGIDNQDATGESGSTVLTLDGVEISDATREFVADVKSVVFSRPELVDVSKVESKTTVGGIKETRGLVVQYSAELTEEQIEEINSTVVESGDWALISLKAFDTEESLTVIMKNGDTFTIRVTDAQDPYGLDGQKFMVVCNENYALSPVNKTVNDHSYLNYANVTSGSDLSWNFEYAPDSFVIDGQRRGGVYISHNGQYIKMTGTSSSDPDRSVTLTNNKEEATIFYVEYDNAKGKYRFSSDGQGQSGILTFMSNSYFGVDNNTSSDAAWMELKDPTNHTIPGLVSPWNILDDNIKVKLFDYSGTTRNNHDTWIEVNPGQYQKIYSGNEIDKLWALGENDGGKNEYRQGWGVNNNRTLLFSGSGFSDTNDKYNYYTGGNDYHAEVMQGIVKNKLNNGYPELTSTSSSVTTDASLGYLFGAGGQNGVTAYTGTDGNGLKGLFRKNSEGYYYYSSEQNYASLNAAHDEILIYSESYNKDKPSANANKIGFFPFDPYRAGQSKAGEEKGPNGSPYNHQFGMTVETEFVYPPDGKLPNGQEMVFNFSGDDDVWVFVDDVLVLDLGGVHQPLSGQINFAQLKSLITDASVSNVSGGSNLPTTKTFANLFEGTGKTFNTQAYSTHTLKFFYLERGGCDSNCNISFNLMTGRPLSMSKKLYGLTDSERAKYKDEPFTFEVLVNNELYTGNSTVRFNAAGEVIDKDFLITNGQVPMKDGETVTITGFKNSAVFSVAEVNAFSSDTFEKPYAERYYLDDEYVRHEEEIASGDLSYVDTSLQDDELKEWRTPTYNLKDTEQVTFSNTLKEKDIEVEKIWNDDQNTHDQITFKVGARAYGENEAPSDYLVDALKKNENSTSNDKEFVLNAENGWKTKITNLPLVTPLFDRERRIIYSVEECQVDGYSSLVQEIDSDQWNLDAVKFWPEDDPERTDVIKVKLKRKSDGQYYNGVDENGTAVFSENGTVYELKKNNDYTYRFSHVPKANIADTPDMANDQYTLEEVAEDGATSQGLVMFAREIIRFKITNTPIQETDPDLPQPVVENHKRIDALRDGAVNPDSSHTGDDLTDIYRLYLDYKVNTVQVPEGVDLLFVIDHSGSMNYDSYGGNKNRALAVTGAINGTNGVISDFLKANDNNQWAAVGFKGPDQMLYWRWGLIPNWTPGPWDGYQQQNAGSKNSEVLSSAQSSGTDTFGRQDANIVLAKEGSGVLTDYTAGFWRAEQFLKQDIVKNDGRKKVVIFIADGIPTLHIPCENESIENAGTATGSYYYPDWSGGCLKNDIDAEFNSFVKDVKGYGYTFGKDLDLYAIALGNQMTPQAVQGIDGAYSGETLLKDMLQAAYGKQTDGNYYSIADSNSATERLKLVLAALIGTNDTYKDIRISDNLSNYVDLYGLENAGGDTTAILRASKCKVTMTDPTDLTKTKTLFENGSLVAANNTTSQGVQILQNVSYDSETKTVTATFNPAYEAQSGFTYTLSFDVKATETAYQTFAQTGYDKNEQREPIKGEDDTDFQGTVPPNETSVGKAGFRSNDGAIVNCQHNGSAETRTYPHPVIQVSMRILLEKIDQTGAALEGAKFQLYNEHYESDKTDAENAQHKIGNLLTSTMEGQGENQKAVIYRDGLDPGTYYLVETESPAGYLLLEGPVKIEIKETNEGKMEVTASINGQKINYPYISLNRDKGEWNIKIINSAGVALPNTGGPGTTLFYLLGIMLTAVGCCGIVMKRKRVTVGLGSRKPGDAEVKSKKQSKLKPW